MPLHEVELLEDHPDLAAQRAKLGPLGAGHLPAEDRDLPFRRVDETVDTAQERRLPRAGEAEDGQELPLA
ncbi:MAG TPA: hypothetical protein PLL76_16530, partial [Thermoanaerobaculia bacterium]|nr:hypothetical protein [Thermoanaerobaculia bacterium]